MVITEYCERIALFYDTIFIVLLFFLVFSLCLIIRIIRIVYLFIMASSVNDQTMCFDEPKSTVAADSRRSALENINVNTVDQKMNGINSSNK